MTLPRWLRRRQPPAHEKLTEVVRWGQWVGGYPVTTDVTDDSYMDAFANPWVYACSSAIASAAATVPLVTSVKRGEEAQPAPTSELGKLLDYMNAGDNQQAVIRQTVLHLALHGNAYWLLLRSNPKAVPMAVQVVAPSVVEAIPGATKYSTVIGQYEITETGGSKTRVSADDVVHFRLPSGEDMYYGQSPIKALEQTINTWLSTQNYNESFFKRGGVPTGVLTSTYELKPENRTIMGELWDQWRTSNAAGRPLILGRDLDYKVLGVSPDGTITKTFPDSMRDTICSVYGVPPCIVGIFEYANYANANAQERMFWSNCVLGYLKLIEQAILEQLAPQFKGGDAYIVAFNTDGVEALQPQLADKATQAAQLVGPGIWTINEAREKLFAMTPVPWGDTFWGTFSQVPLSNIDADEPVLPEDEPEPEPQPMPPALAAAQEQPPAETPPPAPKMIVRLVGRKMQRLSAEGRVAHWKANDARRRTKERVYASAMGGWYDDMAEEMIGNLGASKASFVRSPRIDSIMFDLGKAALKLRDATGGPLKAAYEEAAKEASKLIGVSFEIDTAAEQTLLKARGQLMKTVAETAQDRVRNSLAEGIANGENVEALKERVREWNTSGKEYHVENVARTEVGCAMNTAATDTYRENGFGREWLAVQDDRTREDHAEMDGVTVGPDDQFTLPDGAVCDGPGDGRLGPEHVCNCRCTTAPVADWDGKIE